jgi:hypothetical protein
LYETYCNIENDDYYYKYKNLFLENYGKLNDEARAMHFGILVNLCIRKNMLDSSKMNFIGEEFSLYEIMLQNEYYDEGNINYLQTGYFRSILFTAIKLKKFDWLEKFIKEYSQKVPVEERDNMYNYGNAYLYFEKGDYNASARHLLKISIDEFTYKHDIRNLTLRIYYEIGDYEKAFEMISSFREFLRSSKLLSKEFRNQYTDFINYTEKLLFFKSKQKNIDIKRMKKELDKEDKIISKSWLIEKVEELIPATKRQVIAS